MMKTLTLVGFLALGGCSMMSKDEVTTPGGGGDEGERALAGTMADAQTFRAGDTLTSPVECHTSGYMKVDHPAGEALQLEVTIEGPEGACVDVSYLNANGGSQNGGQMFGEICESRTFDVTGLEGGSFIQLSETGVCKGASISLTLR